MAWEFFGKTEIKELPKPEVVKFAEAISKLQPTLRPVVYVLIDEHNIPSVHFWNGPESNKETARILNDIALTIKKASMAIANEG